VDEYEMQQHSQLDKYQIDKHSMTAESNVVLDGPGYDKWICKQRIVEELKPRVPVHLV
jgi:hypothetical protein